MRGCWVMGLGLAEVELAMGGGVLGGGVAIGAAGIGAGGWPIGGPAMRWLAAPGSMLAPGGGAGGIGEPDMGTCWLPLTNGAVGEAREDKDGVGVGAGAGGGAAICRAPETMLGPDGATGGGADAGM